MKTSIFTKFLFLFWYGARLSSSIAAPRFFYPSLTYSSREKQIASKSSVVIEGISQSDGMGILTAAKGQNINALEKALADKSNDINAKDGDGYTRYIGRSLMATNVWLTCYCKMKISILI